MADRKLLGCITQSTGGGWRVVSLRERNASKMAASFTGWPAPGTWSPGLLLSERDAEKMRKPIFCFKTLREFFYAGPAPLPLAILTGAKANPNRLPRPSGAIGPTKEF
jgi:hypothetical protein